MIYLLLLGNLTYIILSLVILKLKFYRKDEKMKLFQLLSEGFKKNDKKEKQENSEHLNSNPVVTNEVIQMNNHGENIPSIIEEKEFIDEQESINTFENIDQQIKIAELLKSIKELYDLGILSEEEYNKKKNELVNNILKNKTEVIVNSKDSIKENFEVEGIQRSARDILTEKQNIIENTAQEDDQSSNDKENVVNEDKK